MEHNINQGKVFGLGPSGRCDDFAIGAPVVRWNPKISKWMMWYYCRDRAFPLDVAPSLGSGRIAVATSDDGLKWTRHDGSERGGSVLDVSRADEDFDTTHIGVMDVTYNDGKWYLWYFGGDDQTLTMNPVKFPNGYEGNSPRGFYMRPGLAISDDGFSFRKERANTPSGSAVGLGEYTFKTWPNGVIDDEFRLYYTATIWGSLEFVTEYAVSKDAKSWEVKGPVTWSTPPINSDKKGVMSRHISINPLGEGKKWLMVYSATSVSSDKSICVAHSDDGIDWSHLYDEPILQAGEGGAWDDGGVETPQLVMNGSAAYLYYYGVTAPGNSNNVRGGVGLAVSKTGDLRKLERVSI